MDKQDNMPYWVFFAFSSISTRKGALVLFISCILFSVYCAPWAAVFPEHEWIASLFLIDDWSWLAMMAPITLWYWLSLRWMDKHSAW